MQFHLSPPSIAGMPGAVNSGPPAGFQLVPCSRAPRLQDIYGDGQCVGCGRCIGEDCDTSFAGHGSSRASTGLAGPDAGLCSVAGLFSSPSRLPVELALAADTGSDGAELADMASHEICEQGERPGADRPPATSARPSDPDIFPGGGANPQPAIRNPQLKRPPTDTAIAEANRRLEIVEAYLALKRRNSSLSFNGAHRALGVPLTPLWTYVRAYERGGFEALIPRYRESGRRSTLVRLEAELGGSEVRAALEQIKGLGLDTQSVTAASRLFARSDACPEAISGVILRPSRSKHGLPPSLRRAITPTRAEHLAHRGPRALSLGGMWTPRRLDILPGDIFSADDTTPIWAWWVPWVECEEYPFGAKLLQGQFLPVIDVASQACVTFVIIAREKSSYRAADIWHLFGHTFDQVGLPRLGWQLERGSWEAHRIAGVQLTTTEGEVSMTRRVGGLRQLPTHPTEWHRRQMGEEAFACFPKTLQTWTSYLPKSKSVEAFFDRSQTLEGTIWGSLGRDQMRKPCERMKKLYEAAKKPKSKVNPREHFLSYVELTRRLGLMLDYLNNEVMEGEVFSGIPRQKLEQGLADYPLLKLAEDQRWLYARDWRPVRITQGWARVRLTDEMTGAPYSLFYTAPRQFAELEGQPVVVYYDREKFEQPAEIVSARTGEWLCSAEYVDRRGSFLDGDQTGHDIRRQWRNAVMAGYGTIAKHAPSRQVPDEVQARRQEAAARRADGGGQRAERPAPQPISRALARDTLMDLLGA